MPKPESRYLNAVKTTVIRNVQVVNRGRIRACDVQLVGDRIGKVGELLAVFGNAEEIDGEGLVLMPGIIDDQVHFREPGLEEKATIYTESRAAVAGGVTSFMEMPNTKPPAVTQALLADKYAIGARDAWANYSFFMGAANDNLDEVLRTDPKTVCGIKAFMGSSTGNMLVDNPVTLEALFANSPLLIATHCEDEATVKRNFALAEERYGQAIPPSAHPWIRSREACFLSSGLAVSLAKKHGTRLHVLHITTKEELDLFQPGPVEGKSITSEACVHHLFFAEADYVRLGNQIKCNPAIKTAEDREAILAAVLDGRIDVIATDHAPHTWTEKSAPYANAPAGLPLIQHGLQMMLVHYKAGRISLEQIVEWMCHRPAQCFRVDDRGYVEEGLFADLVLLDPAAEVTVTRDNLLYKCAWSPLEGMTLPGAIKAVWVNGQQVVNNGTVVGAPAGRRLTFRR